MNNESSIQIMLPEAKAIQTFKALHLLKDATAASPVTTSILLEHSESGLKLWSTDRYRMLEVYWAAESYAWEGEVPEGNKLSLPLELVTLILKHYTNSQLTQLDKQESELIINYKLDASLAECLLSDGTRYVTAYTQIHIPDWKAPIYEEGPVRNNRKINPGYLGDLKSIDKIWNRNSKSPGTTMTLGQTTFDPIRFTFQNDQMGEAVYYLMEIRGL